MVLQFAISGTIPTVEKCTDEFKADVRNHLKDAIVRFLEIPEVGYVWSVIPREMSRIFIS